MNLATILKMLGVKVSPETVAQLQVLIPQIPTKVNELINANMAAIKSFDSRLQKIENAVIERRVEVYSGKDFDERLQRIEQNLNILKERMTNGRRRDADSNNGDRAPISGIRGGSDLRD